MQDIKSAVELLNAGELVAFPTETVYGLGADATNPTAVKKIFKTKNRPSNHPVIVHLYSENQINDWVKVIPNHYALLAKYFWPGPMTLIFEAKETVSPIITGNQKTIGLRMPMHPISRELLKQFGKPIAAPSANRFGRISPTSVEHVISEFENEIKLIIDGGDCPYGIESTIIDITKEIPVILRPGPLDIETIKKISGIKKINLLKSNTSNVPRVSGSLESHYAPYTPLALFEKYDTLFTSFSDGSFSLYSPIVVMSFEPKPEKFSHPHHWITMPENAVYYAKSLYATMRILDAMHFKRMYVEMPKDISEWSAVRDRLTRASIKH